MRITYFTKELLIKAAKGAERTGVNRRLNIEKLQKLPDLNFPVTASFLHNDTHIRCDVSLGDITVQLDVPISEFNGLPVMAMGDANKPQKVYKGVRDAREPNTLGEVQITVSVNGGPAKELDPRPSQKLRDHSPDGFNWGYGGSGPAQLALGILLDHFHGNAQQALRYYQDFKWKHVAGWPQETGFEITTEQIEATIRELEACDNPVPSQTS